MLGFEVGLLVFAPWLPMWEIAKALLDPDKYLDRSQLPVEKLAKLSLSVVLKRPDSNKWCMDICLVPRPAGIASAQEMLAIVADCLQACTDAHGQIPPWGTVCDAATCNRRLVKAFLGQVPLEDLREHAFFRKCSVQYPDYKFWPYGMVTYGPAKQLMLGWFGGFHVQKRYSIQFNTGIKKIVIGSVSVDLSSMVGAGLPSAAYQMVELQSDKHAACRLSPCYMKRDWCSLGCHLYALLGGLISACSTSSHAFSRREQAINSFTLHYLCMLHLSFNRKKFKSAWAQHTLALTTIRSISSMCAACVSTCKTGLEPLALQELRIEHHFGNVKGRFKGTPTLKDGLLGTSCEHARQVRDLSKLTAAEVVTDFTTQDRAPLSSGALEKIATQSCASAIQLFCMVSVDLSPDEAYAELRTWWSREGARLMGEIQADARSTPDPDEDDEWDMQPGDVEITDELQGDGDASNDQQPFGSGDVALLQKVQDQAATLEATGKYLEPSPEGALPQPRDPAQQLQPPNIKSFNEIFPVEVDVDAAEEAPQPKTLVDIIKRALKKGGAEHQLGDPASLGHEACLRRVTALLGGIRQFCRLVRLEEGLLSAAMLENEARDENVWNQRMHCLSLARKAMNLSQARLSRAQAWSRVQTQYCHAVRQSNQHATEEDFGIRAIETYRANTSATNPQIVAYSFEDDIRLGAVSAVFRGSIVRKMGSRHLGQVRVAKPVSVDIPADCVRMLHIIPLKENPEKATPRWIGSCLEVPVLVDPTNVVLGEIKAKVHTSATRLHVIPSAAAMQALNKMGGMDVPFYDGVPSSAVEQDEAKIPDVAGAADKQCHFSDRSFFKRNMPENVQAFLRGIRNAYSEMGLQVSDAAGFVQLRGSLGKVAWASLLQRAPSYFDKMCRDLAGYRYSQTVYAQLHQLVPKEGPLAFIFLVCSPVT